MDTRYVPPSGQTIDVPAGGNFQDALRQARPGDVIVLHAGVTYSGPFVLPVKTGDGWITVQSSAMASLPAAGQRVSPTDAPAMPALESGSNYVLGAAKGAHHYRFMGIEIRPGPAASASRVDRTLSWLKRSLKGESAPTPAAGTPAAAFLENLVDLGDGATSVDALPHHIIFDRCFIHGDSVVGARRGVAMNARYIAVIDSYLSDFKQAGVDTQAVSAWNSPGPFKITDDYLEAAGENVMFGGEDPSIPGLVPSDIELRGNDLAKPLAWKAGEAGYQGTQWTIKNLFELKNAQRVLAEGNLLEYNWAQSQDGFSVLFTVRDQDGTAPWSVVQDVTFMYNVIRHVANGVNVLGYDDNHTSQQTQRIRIQDNLFDDVGGAWGPGLLLQMVDGSRDVDFSHNTSLQSGSIVFGDGRAHGWFRYRDNIAPQNTYGVIGTGTGPGIRTLTAYFPGAEFKHNVIVGGAESLYPSGNFFPDSMSQVGFVDAAAQDYRLAPVSAFSHRASDGKDLGADMDELCAALKSYGSHLADSVPTCADSAH